MELSRVHFFRIGSLRYWSITAIMVQFCKGWLGRSEFGEEQPTLKIVVFVRG